MLTELCRGSHDSRLPHIELRPDEFEAISPSPTHKLFHNLRRKYFECLYLEIFGNFECEDIIKSITKFKRFEFTKESPIDIHIIFGINDDIRKTTSKDKLCHGELMS